MPTTVCAYRSDGVLRMKKRLRSLAERFSVRDIFTRRLVFTVFTLPTVINLFIFALLIGEGRGFVLGCAAVFTLYFLITVFFEIKTERWTVFTLIAGAALSILVSIFFILAYKLYALIALLAVELAAAAVLTLIRNKLPRKESDED